MEGERPQSLMHESWQKEIIADVERIRQLPESILKKDEVYEVETKSGETLTCETYEVDLAEADRLGIEGIKNPTVGNERLYLIAVNPTGEVAGTRFTTLFFLGDKIEATSSIRVMQKGKGYASPIDDAFQRQLQAVADKKKETVVWRVTNENLERLEEYRQTEGANSQVMEEMEEEQKRWQALYGPDNKLGIDKGRKIFTPRET